MTLGVDEDEPAATDEDESDDRNRDGEVSDAGDLSDDPEILTDLSTDDDDDATVGGDTAADSDEADEGKASEAITPLTSVPGECSYFNIVHFNSLSGSLLAGIDEALRPLLHPTLLAIGEGDPDAVLAAWREKPDEFESSLAIAAWIGCTEVMQPLIDNGANLDGIHEDYNLHRNLWRLIAAGSTDVLYVSVLGTALLSGNLEAVKLLLNSGANPNDVQFNSDRCSSLRCWHVPPIRIALGIAISQENLEAVELLLNSGADPDGSLSLYIAVSIGWTEAVRLLVDSGADPHGWSGDENSLISVALRYGYDWADHATSHPLWDDTIWTVLLDYGVAPTWEEFALVLGRQLSVPVQAFSEVILAAGTGGLQRFERLEELEDAIGLVRERTSMLGDDVATKLIDLLIESQQHLL